MRFFNKTQPYMSLRTAIMLPFFVFMLLIIAIFVLIFRQNYQLIAEEQGEKMINALSENTNQKVSYMLSEPERINKLYAQNIELSALYEGDDLSKLQQYTLELSKSIRKEVPQISVVSYGDELQNFIGYRMSDDVNHFDLMLKDPRTNGLLNIYSDETNQSEIAGSYEGYDPTTRPWYAPVKVNQISQWSEIYINIDEKNEATISSLVPVYDLDNKFRGVADIDVKLSGINTFLANDQNRGNGEIYIIDDEWRIIAHSLSDNTVKITSSDPPTGELLPAAESTNILVKGSADYLIQHQTHSEDVIRFEIKGDSYFARITPLEEPVSLNWRIVVVIPESDLLGVVKQRQSTMTSLVVLLLILSTAIGAVVISKFLRPILSAADTASEISYGNWDARFNPHGFVFYETHQLGSALEAMAKRLQETFNQITFSEEKYRSLIENVDHMIYSVTPEGNIISVNAIFEQTVGRSRESLYNQPLEIVFVHEKDKQYWREQITWIQQNKEKVKLQYQFTQSDGNPRILDVILIPILSSNGTLEMILGTNTDITELIYAQQEITRLLAVEKETLEKLVAERTFELEQAMNELIEKEKLASLGSLVSGISHEINTPLGVAVSAGSYLDQLLTEFGEKLTKGIASKTDFAKFMTDMDESITIINTNIIRAADLVKSFKEIAVKQSIEGRMLFNVHDYLNATIMSLRHEYKEAGHHIELHCDPLLEINSYPGTFSQILTNLLMNSFIHGYSEKRHGQIHIDITQSDQRLVLIYKDDGKGMPPEVVSKIFDPFFTTNRNKGGSGLGLNIVYNLVTGQLGGKIHCESKEDAGTTFTIEIDDKE